MLLRNVVLGAAFFVSLSVHAASGLKNFELRDLYFGEALYYAYQDKHFEALARLDTELMLHYGVDESNLDPLIMNLGQAEFSVGDIELQYRMDKRAGKAIQAVLGSGIDLATRNQAALALARMYYRKDDAAGTLYALDLIRDEVDMEKYQGKSAEDLRGKEPEKFRVEVAYLRGLASIGTGQFTSAVEILQSLRREKSLEGYVLYNLGIAFIQAGQEDEGLKLLDELGRLETSSNDLLALKDKANLKLAYRLLDFGKAELAQTYFQRIRLDGPYSNNALLGAGWAAAALGRYDRALVPWSILHERERTNYSVQEALMAVPYAYSQLQAYGKSANMYDQAMDVFAYQISRLDGSIKSIRAGKFLKALLDEQSKKDQNWVVNLRELPDSPETRYILDLMASNDFQTSYKNYKDLAALEKHLAKWLADLEIFEQMIDIRRDYQEPLLPEVEGKFKKIDGKAKLRLEQRKSLANKIDNILIAPRPDFLATANERVASDRITAFEQYIADHPGQVSDDLIHRVKRLRGMLLWRLHGEYDERLTDAYNHLASLDEMIEAFNTRYYSFIRTRQAATQSYEGYQAPIRRLRTGLLAAQRKLKGVMARQGKLLETMAVNELDARRKRLEDYQIKARFALAESYDRSNKVNLEKQIEEQKQLNEEKLKALENEKEVQKLQQSIPPAEDGITHKDSLIQDEKSSH
jgi:Flp pilus assembly protein TadD